MFWLTVKSGGTLTRIGPVKIGRFGLAPGHGRPILPGEFEFLDENYFSVGQEEMYYEKLNEFGEGVRLDLLQRLRDCALDRALFERAYPEEVLTTSLLRNISPRTVTGQFRRLANGGVRLSEFEFQFVESARPSPIVEPLELKFKVVPDSNPPTNVHVLIGSNGVGKTHLLNQMAQALLLDYSHLSGGWRFEPANEMEDTSGFFASVVSVSFSAFESFDPASVIRNAYNKTQYQYVGLRRTSESQSAPGSYPKSVEELAGDFSRSFANCLTDSRAHRLRKALQVLESDPVFGQADLVSLTAGADPDESASALAASVFNKLSAGHKIVLLTVTRLVELVEERTLVLLDEPEAHLHPPLISAFVRALSNLLIDRNGVAIVATHSPVVLQEVPRRCVWKIRRVDAISRFERPDVETFGENVGTLTREVFGLEVTHSGFHTMIDHAVEEDLDFERIVGRFRGELGTEARAVARALLASRGSNGMDR